MYAKIKFVEVDHNQTSVRSKELQTSEIKAHAAYVSHRSKSWLRGRRSSARFVRSSERSRWYRNPAEQWNLDPVLHVSSHDYRGKNVRHQARMSHCTSQCTPGMCEHLSVPSFSTEYEKLWPIFWNLCLYSDVEYSRLLKVRCWMTEEFFHYMTDEAMFHAGSAYLYNVHEALTKPCQKRSLAVLNHSTEALKVIRKRVEQSRILDNATLLAILILPYCDDDLSSVEAFKAHWKGVDKLLETRLAVKSIQGSPGGQLLNDLIEGWAPFARKWLGLKVPIEMTKVERPPFQILVSPKSLSTLPIGFQRLHQQGKIGTPACRLALNYIDVSGPNTIRPHPDDLSHSFQHTWGWANIKPSSVVGEPPIEMILCSALQACCIRLLGTGGIVAFAPKSTRWHLTTALRQCLKTRTEDEEHALFWAWVLALDLWKVGHHDLPSWGVLLRDLHITRFSSFTAPGALRGILEAFFCDDELVKSFEAIKTC